MFTAIKSDPAWRLAIGSILIGRVAWSAWALVLVRLYPVLVTNLTLFGVPVVAAFDQRTSDRFAYGRALSGRELHMRAASSGIVDVETASVWNLSGEAISGTLVGNKLPPSPFTLEQIFPYVGIAPVSNGLLAPWQRFDTNWYLKIATRGYSPDDGSTVYFPLYPLLIKLVAPLLLGDHVLAALVISGIALVGACVLLYRMTVGIAGVGAAQRAVILLLLFPTAFFLFSGYTEALFLFLSLAALYKGREGDWLQAGIWGSLAALTRFQGVLLIVPLAYLLWQQGRPANPSALFLFLIPLAAASYFVWQFSIVGNGSFFGAYEGQLHARFVMPWENVGAAVSLVASGRASLVDILNLCVTFIFGGLILAMWRQSWMPREFSLYALVMYLAPLFRMTTEQPLVSMVRYVIVLFPVFIALAVWGRNPWARRAVVYVSMPLALFLCAQFVMWGWVG